MIELTLQGDPLPWMAPRLSRYRTYSPRSAHMKAMRIVAESLYTGDILDGALDCDCLFYLHPPESASTRMKMRMLSGEIRPKWKPDRTNLCKLAEDILQGIVYTNDSRIVGGRVEKWYSLDPRTVFRITEL